MIPFQSQIATVTLIAGPMERLNAVTVSAAQLQGALERLALLRGDLRDKPVAQALALQAFAAEEASAENDAAAALHARIVALVRWTAAHDPHPPVRCRIRDRGGVALSPQRER
ncbi:hypothetical protein [Sphingomonas baiyangensis]|jgi:hypothetical protein|uniref:Uncharacterized protein n=1 Tax=Sphingomonas baiyangensis TaxID=2572576 RepID=A0A4U1L4J0_9SPHN|nr:hypothetical protein [Sphingomonas baiyangensis]TKD51424.1 hypothetical protein FBR43_12175 [Sphingomonas baiyangensis]